jgi:hypothetical protein
MKRLLVAIALVAAVVVTSCRGSDIINPPTGPGTVYPCGVWGIECPDHSCCPQGHICGGYRGNFTTCPEGYCCYRGDPWPGASASTCDAGATDAGEPMHMIKARAPR